MPSESGVLDRILAFLNPPTLAPNVQEGIRILQQEQKDFDPSMVSAKSGLLSPFQVPSGAEAALTPFGNIKVDPEMMKGKSPQDVADTLLHEFTHSRQQKERGVIGQILHIMRERLPYGQRPDEMEAFQAEADRRTRMGRAPEYGTPHFLDDSVETRGDIALFPKFVPPQR